MSPQAYQTLPNGPIDINSSQGTILKLQLIYQGAFNKPVTEVIKGWKKLTKQ